MKRQAAMNGWQDGRSTWLAMAFVTLVTIAASAADETTRSQIVRPLEPQPSRQIVVSIDDRKLALLEGGRVVKMYDVAVGAAVSPSPTGAFTVVNRLTDPTYYHSGKVIPAGKDNPLGTRWMGLSAKGFGIHGTNQPKSIGRAASHGCIRMAKKDLEELFQLVRVGDSVEIRSGHDELIASIFGTSAPSTTMTAQSQHATEAAAVAVGQ